MEKNIETANEQVVKEKFVINRIYRPVVKFTQDEDGSIVENIQFNPNDPRSKRDVTILDIDNCQLRVSKENLIAHFSYQTTSATASQVSSNFYETAGMIADEIQKGTFSEVIVQARKELREYDAKKRNDWSETLKGMIDGLKAKFNTFE